MVSRTESLMSLQRIKPSRHSSKSCIVSVGIGKRWPISGSFSMTYPWCEHMNAGKRGGAYAIDVVCKLLSLVLVDGVAHIGIRALDGDFTGSGGQYGGFGLGS